MTEWQRVRARRNFALEPQSDNVSWQVAHSNDGDNEESIIEVLLFLEASIYVQERVCSKDIRHRVIR
jgi:hypothetical protein